MKKQPLCALILITFLQTARAQTDAPKHPAIHKWSLDLSAGLAVPVGKFASNDYNAESGHAKVGATAEFAVTRWLNPSFGITFAAAGQENSIGKFTTYTNPGPAYSTEYDSWKLARLLAGVSFNRRLSKTGFSIGVRALAGVLKTSAPGYTEYIGNHQNEVRTPSSPLHWAFAYEAGAGLKWQSTGKLFLLLDAAYAGSTPEYMRTYNLIEYGRPASYAIRHNQPISTVQFRVGAGLRL